MFRETEQCTYKWTQTCMFQGLDDDTIYQIIYGIDPQR